MSDQCEALCEIKDFTEFLEKCLDRKVLEYTLKPLTKPGDNYGSVMQSVEVKIAGSSDSKESNVLHLVAKTSVTNPFLVKVFKPAFSFVKEAHFYSDIIPSIVQLERAAKVPENERIDTFIKCLGSRISLDPKAKRADIDAVILLENIKVLNYKNINRHVGFDSKETQATLKQLAKFHSSCIALRMLQPEVFSSRIKPFLEPIHVNDNPNGPRMINTVCDELRFVDNLNSEWRDKTEKQLRISYDLSRITYHVPDTPFTTVVHRDLWANNVMIKKDDVKPMKTKIYDFQVYYYETFVFDLIFFLGTSVSLNELAQNFKSFIMFYHAEFIKTLKLMNCPLEDYTFEKMWHEIQEKAKFELLHVLFFVKIVLVDESGIPDLDKFSPDNLLDGKIPSKELLNRWKLIFELFIENGLL